ncbi:peptidase inhibitor family I36 protein [Streptomyces brevispora]|uniref:peptidase inhibitor family I36 protein n=1 Tax=Streptomyces brevispora TaxID=887462 RepID=UPI002E303914|nr:peptidase inhibitor family I36 protein [Streptomyces brevispora]
MRSSVMRRWTATAVSMLAVAAAPILAPAAHAAEGQCSEGKICYWSEPDYQGKLLELDGRIDSCSQAEARWPDGSASQINSAKNRSRNRIEAFDSPDCSGEPYASIGPGQEGSLGRAKSLRIAPVSTEQAVKFYLRRGDTSAILTFDGKLSWSGPEYRTYTVSGRLLARCYTAARYTVWLQYGGTNEKWKDSSETGCSDAQSQYHDITVSGTLAPANSLELRLGTWTFASWQYSDRQNYAPPA